MASTDEGGGGGGNDGNPVEQLKPVQDHGGGDGDETRGENKNALSLEQMQTMLGSGDQWGGASAAAAGAGAGMPMGGAMGGYYNPYLAAQQHQQQYQGGHMMPGMMYGGQQQQQHQLGAVTGMPGSNPYGDILSGGGGSGAGVGGAVPTAMGVNALASSMILEGGGSVADAAKEAAAASSSVHPLVAGLAGKEKQKRRKRPKDKPKRPLSAYNVFFKEERGRILSKLADEAGDEDGDDAQDKDDNKEEKDADGDDDKDKDANAPKTKKAKTESGDDAHTTSKSKAERKKKPHGKIGFESLAKTIGARWKDLPKDKLSYYKKLAEVDSERYARDMEAYGIKQEKERQMESKALSSSSGLKGMTMVSVGTELTAKDEAEQIAAAVSAAYDGQDGGDNKGTKKKRGRSKKGEVVGADPNNAAALASQYQTANSLAASNAFTAAMGGSGAGGMNPAMMGYGMGMGMGMHSMGMAGMPYGGYGYGGAPGMDMSASMQAQMQGYGMGMMGPMGGSMGGGGGPADGGQASAGSGGVDSGTQVVGGGQPQVGFPGQQLGYGGYGMGAGDAQGNMMMPPQMAGTTEPDGGSTSV